MAIEVEIMIEDLFPNTHHKFTTHGQMLRVLDELAEAEEELNKNNRNDFLMEMIDVLHSASGVLYKSHYNFTSEEINDMILYVQEKNRKRGYYDK